MYKVPEKDITTYQMLGSIGVVLTTVITFFISILNRENKKLAGIEKKLVNIGSEIHEVETDLHEFREYVAVKYPSHTAMQACSDNITKSMNQGFRAQAAELKLVMQDVVRNDCPHCIGKKHG